MQSFTLLIFTRVRVRVFLTCHYSEISHPFVMLLLRVCYLICLIYSLLEADNTGNCTGALQLLSSSYAQLLGIILCTDCFTISQSMYAFGLVLSGQCRDGAGPDKNR